jgi:hypothetical protein
VRNRGGKMGKLVTKAKFLIARMSKEEILEMEAYVKERWKVIRRREEEVKTLAQWEKVAHLSIGSEVAVNAYGYTQFPRGTVLTVDSFNTRGPKRICLKTTGGKRYNFSPENIGSYDIKPLTEVDTSKPWEKGVLEL